jgi:hypothetical protein
MPKIQYPPRGAKEDFLLLLLLANHKGKKKKNLVFFGTSHKGNLFYFIFHNPAIMIGQHGDI